MENISCLKVYAANIKEPGKVQSVAIENITTYRI